MFSLFTVITVGRVSNSFFNLMWPSVVRVVSSGSKLLSFLGWVCCWKVKIRFINGHGHNLQNFIHFIVGTCCKISFKSGGFPPLLIFVRVVENQCVRWFSAPGSVSTVGCFRNAVVFGDRRAMWLGRSCVVWRGLSAVGEPLWERKGC